jgi:hypothetical protein
MVLRVALFEMDLVRVVGEEREVRVVAVGDRAPQPSGAGKSKRGKSLTPVTRAVRWADYPSAPAQLHVAQWQLGLSKDVVISLHSRSW